jgi:hypothetical protein
MRDNHTFRSLTGGPEEMVAQALAEFDAGWTSGMLCSNARQITVRARGRAHQAEFARSALAALQFVALAGESDLPQAFNPTQWIATAVGAVVLRWPAEDDRGSLHLDTPGTVAAGSRVVEFCEKESAEERWAILRLQGDEVRVSRGSTQTGVMADPLTFSRKDDVAAIATAIVDYLAGAPRE